MNAVSDNCSIMIKVFSEWQGVFAIRFSPSTPNQTFLALFDFHAQTIY